MIDSRLETCVKHCHIHTVASPIAWAALTGDKCACASEIYAMEWRPSAGRATQHAQQINQMPYEAAKDIVSRTNKMCPLSNHNQHPADTEDRCG